MHYLSLGDIEIFLILYDSFDYCMQYCYYYRIKIDFNCSKKSWYFHFCVKINYQSIKINLHSNYSLKASTLVNFQSYLFTDNHIFQKFLLNLPHSTNHQCIKRILLPYLQKISEYFPLADTLSIHFSYFRPNYY